MNGYDEFDESYDESWDESDVTTAFEDLEYDEARRRRRRRHRPRRGRVPAPAPPRPGASANLQRDRQLARAVNVVNEDVSDMEARLAKVNGDLARLKQISLVSLLLPRGQTLSLTRLGINDQRGLVGTPNPTGAPAEGQVDVVTNVASKLDIVPLVLFMSMARGIGTAGRGGAATAAGTDGMMPLMLVVLLSQQQQAAGQPAAQAAGGLDPTTLLVLMMAMGGLS